MVVNGYRNTWISVLCISLLAGCFPFCNQSESASFKEISFPDIYEPIYLDSFETRQLSESFSEMTTVRTVSNLAFLGSIMDKDGNIYGSFTDRNTPLVSNLGKVNLVSGESQIIAETESGDYSSMSPYLLADDYLIYRDHDSAPYMYKLFYLDLKTNEKKLIEQVDGIGGAMDFDSDSEGIMFSREDPSANSESSIFYWDFSDNLPERIVSNSQGPFLIGDTWYCRTYAEKNEDPSNMNGGITLARFNKNGKKEKITLINQPGTLTRACKLDETHILLVFTSCQGTKTRCRFISYDITDNRITYLFDTDHYVELLEVVGNYIRWAGGNSKKYGAIAENLFDLKNKVLYQPDYLYIEVSEYGIAFNSYPPEEEQKCSPDTRACMVPSYEYWHYGSFDKMKKIVSYQPVS